MNESQLSALVASAGRHVQGNPGDWDFSSASFVASTLGAGAADPTVAPANALLIENAISQSNAAALKTPSAATDAPVSKTTPRDTVNSILTGLDIVAAIGDDITAIEKGGTAHLHWWGWEANLDEEATQALIHLLSIDVTKLGAVLAAFAAMSPMLAAVAGIMGIVSAALGSDVKNADQGNGVNMKGYLWVGLSVHAN